MIKGIETDLVEKKIIKNLFLKYGNRFVDKVLTKPERKDSRSPYLNLNGMVKKQALIRKYLNFMLRISDTKYYSLDFVIGEEK